VSAHSRRRLARIALAALALLVALELGLRGAAALTGRARGVRFDADLGWRMLPGVEKHGRFWGRDEPARTSSRGWREEEFTERPAPGVRRVVALGDSFTFGVSVDRGERFTERLEELLEGVELLNLGVTAYGPDQELRLLEVEALRYRPEVVLMVLFLANDLDDVLYERKNQWPKPIYVPEHGALRFVPAAQAWDVRLRESCYLGEGLFRLLEPALPRDVFAPALAGVDPAAHLAALLARADAACRAAGAELLAVLVHSQRRGAAAPPAREAAAREALAARGVPFVDTWDVFAAALEDGRPVYAPDGHWSAEGHLLVARLLAPRLAR
jgi:hypothetical protein